MIFFMRTSTTGKRGVNLSLTYSLTENNGQKYECKLKETLELETIEPFSVSSELLRYVSQVAFCICVGLEKS